eukprot:CAMPEP_0183502214 /NCGR_PEP_ID=MMETSP0371-20130417/4090_1 /TAXON_ID=268820 /ORGANISM="Peridinium aciculiferum, Strain PAER-2" /LENGTH=162 /DNA_ID=CAMNT_0025696881 /DNA_START=182 /DNA_END=667 /DNA_ORIENTATION=-
MLLLSSLGRKSEQLSIGAGVGTASAQADPEQKENESVQSSLAMSMCLEATSKLRQPLHKRLCRMACDTPQVQRQLLDGLLDLMTVLRQAVLNRSKQGLQAHRPQGQDQHALAALRHRRGYKSKWAPAVHRDVAEDRPSHDRVVHRLNLLLQSGQHQGSPLQR